MTADSASRAKAKARATSPFWWRPTWAAYAACVCALVYAVMKLSMAAEGRIGLPGGPPVADDAYNQYDHVALRQLGLVAVDIVAALVALAFVRPWGRFIPRWMLLLTLGVGVLALAAGAFAVVQNALFGPEPMDWASVLLAGFMVVWVLLWAVTTCFYSRRSRPAQSVRKETHR